jgi:nucleotide-binding universal stress UspA family protein
MSTIPRGSIIVATDGSPASERAVIWASEQAVLEGRRLFTVSVAGSGLAVLSAGAVTAYTFPADELLDAAWVVALEAADLARKHRAKVCVEGRALLGDTRSVLLDLSRGAHLMVLGSRGRGRAGSALLGSVSASVSRHAHCPVVVCRPEESVVRYGVAVGVDGSPQSRPVVDFAFRIASLRHQPLTAVRCFRGNPPPPTREAKEARDAARRLLLSESLVGIRDRYPDVAVTLRPESGSAVDGIAALARSHAVVVVGRHPVDTLLQRLGGALSTAVLERSPTVVAVVPEDEVPAW